MTKLAGSYAKTLYKLQVTPEEVTQMERVINQSDSLKNTLLSPIVLKIQKKRVIDRIFQGTVRKFLQVLNQHGHLYLLDEIIPFYREYYDQQEKILRVKLFYVQKPAEEELTQIKNLLKEKFNKSEVVAELIEKKELLDGFLLQAKNWEMDWSLKGRFDQLQQKLTRR